MSTTHTHASHYSMLIDGRSVQAEGAPADVLNPATEEVVGTAPDITDAQYEEALESAGRAFPAWRDTPLEERRKVLVAMARIIEENLDELTALHTAEQGKPLAAARLEWAGSARWLATMAEFDYHADETREEGGRTVRVRHTPYGVVAGIVPWNFPVALAVWKVAPALLTGNTLVLKPSPYTPLTMLRFGELVRDVVPAGVLNIVSGTSGLGNRLTSDPRVAKISLTGSTATGKAVMATASQRLARVTLELGGNDAAIVLPDVDLDTTVEKVFWAAFVNSAQICIGAKRIYVHDSIYDAFAERFAKIAETAVVGNGAEDGVELGPVQNVRQYQRVRELIEATEQAGHRFLVKGDIPEGPGYFIHPTVVDNPPDDARIVREEPFGPIVPLLRYSTVDEAVARANDSEYGLAGSVWSSDPEAAAEVAARLDTGVVWVNAAQVLAPGIPFSGHKESGIGHENGVEGVQSYTNTHVVSLPTS
jgi:acyl-CoA reductase-like NAD-dependent aldehyde dehydrogenase